MIRCVVLLVLSLGLYGFNVEDFQIAEPHVHQVSICAVFKNEAKQLREWIEYHRLIGVDHFYLYNSGSSDNYFSILGPYIEQKVVTLVDWPEFRERKDLDSGQVWLFGTKFSAYENAVRFRSRNETKWLLFLDVNEYVAVHPGHDLSEYMSEYGLFDAVELTAYQYESIADPKVGRLAIESRKFSQRNPINPFLTVSKWIVRPKQYLGFIWDAQGCDCRCQHKSVRASDQGIRVNRYLKEPFRSVVPHCIVREVYLSRWQMSKEELQRVVQENEWVEDSECRTCNFVPQLRQRLAQSRK